MIHVVLSVAKDPIAACYRHEILRFAQDDRKRAWRPAVRQDYPITFFSRSVAISATLRPASSAST